MLIAVLSFCVDPFGSKALTKHLFSPFIAEPVSLLLVSVWVILFGGQGEDRDIVECVAIKITG